ncbi:TIGR04222 domain-containing membrane protein [Porphyrobacter sp. LM 6]|uniref:TIGR04222 domain-containing membrane protein n=1 Tax=Porphyrobacter sp. LM 6 TaxID=1896196 RepID=UPI000847804A|nr:TIGR04222 domain-containing membrane protein [Porphyrobacter sp. LM 6]AOL95089.1 TIGR04222 domain-containing protein [Porphyrobacter sp. LM 6]
MQLFSSWTGSDFLLVYIVLLGTSGLLAWWIPNHFRPLGQRAESSDAEDIAMLSGGGALHSDSLLADLIARGGIAEASGRTLCVVEPGLPTSAAGRALLALRVPFTLGEAGRALQIHQNRIAARLRRAGLLLGPEQRTRLRWLSVAPLLGLLVVGFYRQRSGSMLGEATEMLVGLLIVTAAVALARFVRFDPRTKAGIQLLREMQDHSAHLRQGPTRADEAGLAVALFGTQVLANTPWAALHTLRRAPGDGGMASTSDGGTDCSGDGGGCGD